MKFSGKTYEVLKWLVLILLPALSTFYSMLAEALSLPAPDTVAKVIAAVCFFIKGGKHAEECTPWPAPRGALYRSRQGCR